MKEKKSLIAWGMKNKAFPIALAVTFFIIGLLGLTNMSRNEFPDFTMRTGLVVGFYPGASAEEVEAQLTSKLEEYLFSYNEVDKIKTYSYSQNGMSYVYLEVSNKVSKDETQQFWNKLKNNLFIFQQTSLPSGVKGVVVNSDFGNTAAMILAVESKTRPYKDLQLHVEEIIDNLRQIDRMAKVSYSGGLKEQIAVYADPNRLAQFGISPAMLMQSLKTEGSIKPAGTLEGDRIDYPIHINASLTNIAAVAQHIIKSDENGSVVRISDVAKVKREYEDPDAYVQTNGSKGIIITLEMTKGNNIVHFGEEIKEHLAQLEQNLPDDISIRTIADQPEAVDHSISHFMKEFGYALLGVILVSMLLLPFRVASLAAATIPITIAATLAVMYIFGMELNTVTLAALIVVLGIVVDDPIVVIDNYIEKLDEGKTRWEAAYESATELFPSVFTATLAISATFFPLMFFMSGTAKDFLSTFPFTISIALFLSLTISILLVPHMNTVFIKKGLHSDKKEGEEHKKSMLDYIQSFFNKSVEKAMEHYKITVLAGVLSIVLGVMIFSNVSEELFPIVERNQFAVEVNLSKGSNLEETAKIVNAFEKVLAKDERIVNYTSFIGESSPRFHMVYAPNLPAKNYAQILVTTTSNDDTEAVLKEYDTKYAQMFPNAYLRMKQLNMVGKPAAIEIKLYGNNISEIKKYGDSIINLSRETPQTIWSRTDYGEMYSKVGIAIKEDQATQAGITKDDIANTIAMHMEGLQAAQIYEGNYAVNIKVKSENNTATTISDLQQLSVIVPRTGKTIPLTQVATIKPEWEQQQIVRQNGMRCLTVRVDIEKGAVANVVLSKIMPKIETLHIPSTIKVAYGGEQELSEENLLPMGISLMVSVVLIILILIWHFKSYKHAFLSFITMPLSILGAAIGLLLMQYPFGFTSFLGILALCGIVVRNGIILIDYADELYNHHGKTIKQAAILSAQRRMRPIFLTSAAAAVGVTPMIISRSSLWGPLGTVIAFGLLVSMVLTLFVLPILYWLFFRADEVQKEIKE
ncbi:acriflavin resistance protein [Cellulophaga algicola DSM 14237]|uniref:Acriflavin resistance protein n=1 Tax=Cellulophaga algicola (strain DSM 14237 / IC166 / ACAM 630) TaxID=688270 RepID=E6X5E2_CELAD|nr:efflux RND transporter permease subunit [Cellulophaga algicola]ADV50497.1 acriflavin resistance protein [Cellulophaga algicola DSM 14237]